MRREKIIITEINVSRRLGLAGSFRGRPRLQMDFHKDMLSIRVLMILKIIVWFSHSRLLI